ncbi:MAG: outer membrane beta-barrel protein, partial [Thermoanaerobaculia bacterium]|nr:outer membrane beta-barrel protein [Thermoanaerobaculia bacterium]
DDIDFDENDQLFFDDRLDLLERTTSSITLEANHHTFPITHTKIGAVFYDHEFHRVDLRDSDQSYIYVGAEREIAGRSMTGRIGYTTLDYQDPDVEDYDGILGDLALGFQIGNRNQLRLQYVRDVEFSIFQNNTHYVTDRLFINDTHEIGSRLKLHIQAQGGVNSYLVPVSTPAGMIEREDELYFIGAGPSYRFFDRFELGFVIGPWERNSNIPGETADGIRWHVLLSFN